jgi:hypothetical protein
MIFLLGVLWGQEPTEIPIADQKVIQYLLDKSPIAEGNPLSEPKVAEGNPLPISLQKELSEQAKPVGIQPQKPGFQKLDMPWWWGLLLGALILGALRLFLRKNNKEIGSVQVHSRSFFGQDGSVAVVEVKDARQNSRMFLLGLHSKGSPRFLADLSAPLPFPELNESPASSLQFEFKDPSEEKQTELNNPKEQEKEALVEQILRMRENKVPKEKSVDDTPKRDKWTEGFHEVLRK